MIQVTKIDDYQFPRIESLFQQDNWKHRQANVGIFSEDAEVLSAYKVKGSVITFRVAGFTHPTPKSEDRTNIYRRLHAIYKETGSKFPIAYAGANPIKFRLKRESENTYDKNSVAVYGDVDPWPNFHMGYLPQAINKQLVDYYSNFDSNYLDNIEMVTPYLLAVDESLPGSHPNKTKYSITVGLLLDQDYFRFCPYKGDSRLHYIDE